jgi:large subunit ribosomal protein L25
MARKELTVAPREIAGKKVAQLRRQGMLPANIYGHGVASLAVQVSDEDLRRTIRASTANEVIDVKVDGERDARSVVIHHVQRHPLSSAILHANFYQVSLREKMRADVPLTLIGTSDAVETYRGVLLAGIESLHIEALPLDIPTHIEVDISALTELETALHVRDLKIPGNVSVLVDEDVVVARVAAPAVSEEETPAEEAGAQAPAAETAGQEDSSD